MTFLELKKAVEIFGLSERATLKQVKARHRELVRRFHPDGGSGVDQDGIRLVNAAYRILTEYCGNYAFSFAEEEFYNQNPEERLRSQFADVPHWGSR